MRQFRLYGVLVAFLSALFWTFAAPGTPAQAQKAQAQNQIHKDVASLDKILARAGGGGNVAVDDMFFVTSQLKAYRDELAAKDDGSVKNRLAMHPYATTWPTGIVYYEYSSNTTDYDKAQFELACREWEKYAHLHFVPASSGNRLFVQNSNGNNSYIGMIGETTYSPGGAQPFNIYNWNYPIIICHELAHALGMIHEQSRSDRDDYVTVLFDNITTGYASNFDLIPGSYNTGPYNYESAMHYPRDGFGESDGNGGKLDTLIPNGSNYDIWVDKIGQRDHLSDLDKSGMASIYGAPTPYEPLNAVATAQSSSVISVTWQQNSANTTGYRVERSLDGTSFSQLATTTDTTYTNSSLAAGTKYYYRIYATNATGRSPLPSNVTSATTQVANQTLTITTPANGTTVSTLTAISGTAISSDGIDRVSLTLRRGDGTFWSGSQWGAAQTALPTALGANNTWTLSTGLPNGSNLIDSTYTITASLFIPNTTSPVKTTVATFTLSRTTNPPTQLWRAVDLSVGADNLSRLLWTRPDRGFAVWTLSASNTVSSTPLFGPIAGISASALGVGGDNKARTLLNSTDGKGIVWTMQGQTSGSITSTPAYGPISGFTCREIAVGANNLSRLLWTRSDGAFVVWTVAADGSISSTSLLGPISGWSASAISVGGDGKTTILLNNVDGRAAVWTVQNPATGQISSTPAYGPISGFSCADLATDKNNNTRLLWRRTSDGAFAVWTASASSAANNFTSTNLYGPIAGWTGVKVGVGADLKSRVLLTHTDGRAVVWTLEANGSITSTPAFGPIATPTS